MRDKKSETLTNNRTPDLQYLRRYKQHPIKFRPQTSLTLTLRTYIKFEQLNKKLIFQQKHKPKVKMPVLNRHKQNFYLTTVEIITMVP